MVWCFLGHAILHMTKQPNLKFKARFKQLLGSLPLAFALPGRAYSINASLPKEWS